MQTRDMRFATPKAPRHQMVLYSQCLDEMIAEDAPVRVFAGLLDEVDWSAWEAAYVGFGQPPIHPRYVAGAILYGLMHKVRSLRELETAACKHVDFIWLLEGFTPDHSTFGQFRQRHGEGIEDLKRQIAKRLLGDRERPLLELLIDGTRVRADSDRHGARTAKIIEAIIAELDRRMEVMKRNDDAGSLPQTPCFEGMEPDGDAAERLEWVNQEIVRLEQQREKFKKALDVAHKRDARSQEHDGKKAKPVRVPVTDPESQIAPNKEGGFAPNYTPIAATDAETGAIIYDDVVDGSDEASAVVPAVETAEALTGQKPAAVLADGNFAAGEVLATLDAEGIEAYMPVGSASPADNPAQRPDPTQPVPEADLGRLPKHGRHFARAAFVYDADANAYHCPMGHAMTPFKHGKNTSGVQYTYYKCHDCPACPLAAQCIKGQAPFRTITRDEFEPLRKATAERMASQEGRAIYQKRAPGIEGVFAHIKSCMGIRRFSRRGLKKVRCDWSWICAAYNLKKLLARAATTAFGNPGEGCRAGYSEAADPNQRIVGAIGAIFAMIERHQGPPNRGTFTCRIYPIWTVA